MKILVTELPLHALQLYLLCVVDYTYCVNSTKMQTLSPKIKLVVVSKQFLLGFKKTNILEGVDVERISIT